MNRREFNTSLLAGATLLAAPNVVRAQTVFNLKLGHFIALLFAVLTIRLLLRSAAAREPFAQLGGAGLAIVVAVQAFINMGVAVSLLPAKGMTLPFVSYGGSSLFAVALTMGFALALIRHRPQVAAREQPLFGFLKGARA